MKKQPGRNYAFIDAVNLHLGTKNLGWKIDYRKLRIHLKETFGVEVAYMFLGNDPDQGNLHRSLQKDGFILIFKEVLKTKEGKIKGNCDAELILQAMIDYGQYEQAVIVSSDGDFSCLVRYLLGKGKLKMVISPSLQSCSVLLKKAAKGTICFLDDKLRNKLEYK